MEATCSLKPHSQPPDKQGCFICQEEKDDHMKKCGNQGLEALKKAAIHRDKLNDVASKAAISRVCALSSEELESGLWCHKGCYSTFTSSRHIQRLERKTKCTTTDDSEPSTSKPRISRSSTSAVNWEACIFCQNVKTKEVLCSVTTFKMSSKILDLSNYDQILHVRLSGMSDLIAAEGKYHPNCFKRFEKKTTKAKESTQKLDLPMQWLAVELRESAKHAHVLQMSEVFNRYCELAENADFQVPASFISRLSTFKDKLQVVVEDVFDFVTVPKQDTLLVPRKFGHLPYRDLISDNEQASMIPKYQPQDEDFLEMVHVALKLRGDILAHPKHTGFVVSEDDMIRCVPTRLFMFIRLMFGGQSLLEGSQEEPDDIDMSRKESDTQTRVLSVAQDLVYNVTGGRHWTPKHIGLASTLHQATRSRELVELFHNAGHVISYHSLLQVDTAMAEKTLQAMDPETGAVTPPNFVPGRFTHFTCDNIDINDASLDGKNSFHATQMAAWQRGPEGDMMMRDIRPSQKETLQVPGVMEEVFPAGVVEGKTPPALTENTSKEWFKKSDHNESAKKATAQDMAFVLKRQDDGNTKEGWTSFNKAESTEAPEVTSVGYMPIIQAPAHDLDTLNTVVLRCKKIADNLGQHHVVLTVDEALFYKLMELKWTKPEYQDFLIVRLGGLHVTLKFLEVIGKHVQSSGIQEAWVEGDLLGAKTAEKVMAGKSYDKGMRAHKITLQALWRILLPKLLSFMEDQNPDLKKELLEKTHNSTTEDLLNTLASEEFKRVREDFLQAHSNPNFKFWWGYLEMVHILLLFTRALRDGDWDLHLHAFQCMLPYFMRYNQTNYARWGTIYLNEMHQLPEAVKQEFEAGNFVVKRSSHHFNQVSPDHAQEWLNGLGKKGGGIIGITKTTSALSRWALSYNLRSHIALETRLSFGLGSGDDNIHNETTKGRKKIDLKEEDALLCVLQRFGLFSDDAPQTLQNIANKDLATQEIEDDLLLAANKGQDQLDEFVEERLLPREERKLAFRDTLPKNKYLTFSSLFVVQISDARSGKTITVKADRNILQRLISAYEAGRQVNLNNILTHELFVVPLALAQVNGQLRTGSKAVLAEVLTTGVSCPDHLDATDLGEDPVLIIDGQAQVVAIGKPKTAKTFGDLSDTFVETVLQSGSQFKRIDVMFDRYFETSIKSGTRKRRGKNTVAIRRPVSSRDVPLPATWENFMAHEGNKEDLARFLSTQLILQAPPDKVIVAAGGWSNPERVESSDPRLDVENLEGFHEEADTRTILHCVKTTATSIVVSARDTDILVMLIAFFHLIPCHKIWMKAGTAKKRKFIPVHAIVEHLQMNPEVLEILPAFHALTGSDTTSYLAGHSKKTCWEVFKAHHNLIKGLGNNPVPSEQTIKDAEEFVCKVYGDATASSINEVRVSMFVKGVTNDKLPPTGDALLYHIKRSHYQALVWCQAHLQHPVLPPPETMGWKMKETSLIPELSSLPPVPKACEELISCTCSTGCKTKRCSCKKANMPCVASCKCQTSGELCRNV